MAISPPLPKRFTKQYREEQLAKQKNEQARIQYEEAQRKYEQEKVATDRRNALVEKYNKGRLSFSEYKELTGSSSLENYYYYIAPRDQAEGDRIAAQLFPGGYGPQYGGKRKDYTGGFSTIGGGEGYVSYDPNTIRFPVSVQAPKQEEFLIASSTKGPDVFITNKGNEATRMPASFMDRNERFTVSEKKREMIPQPISNLDKFYLEREMAIERLRSQGPIQNITGAGVSALFGTAKLISYPKNTYSGLSGFFSEGSKDPIGFGKKIGKEQIESARRDPVLYGASFVVFGNVSKGITRPFARYGLTKFSRFEEAYNPKVLKNVSILPTQSIPSTFKNLETLTGKNIEVAHVSPGKFKTGFIENIRKEISGQKANTFELTGPPTYTLSPYRKAIEQKSFYVYPTEKPGTYEGLGGYAGFYENVIGKSKPKISFSLFPTEKQILISKQPVYEISGINKPGNIEAIRILKEQEKFPNRVYQAAENQAFISTERQLTIPSKVEAFPITGRSASIGSTIKLNPLGKSFARRNVAPKFLPGFLRKSDFFTETQTFKVYGFEFVKSEPRIITKSSFGKNFGADYSTPTKNVSIATSTISYPISYTPITLSNYISSVKSKNKEILSGSSLSSEKKSVGFSIRSSTISYRPRYPSGYSPPRVPRYESPPSIPRSPSSPPSYPYGSSYDYLGKSRGPSPPSRGYYYPPPSPPSYPGGSRKRDQSYPSIRKDSREFGFIPVLYKGGKPIKTLTNRPLVRSEAIAFGANIVNSLTKRSFKLVRAGTAVPYGIKGPVNILRPGKRDRFLFVERSKYAINTRGEKYGLRQARLTKKRGFRL